jgi:CDP-diacylglycerol--glycerol-3-phosphate 3-phosphatidyltransferase
MLKEIIGDPIAAARDALARRLVKARVPPNAVTTAGVVITVLAGVCYALSCPSRPGWSMDPNASANAYLMIAFALLIASFACDMLDGAVARIGGGKSLFGGFLDSTLDRYSDFAVYAGIAFFYARTSPPNTTFVLLSMLTMCNCFVISYTRARSESVVKTEPVGYWQRAERAVAVLSATLGHNIPFLLVQQSLSGLTTAIRRIFYTKAVMEGRHPITDPRQGNWWLKVRVWRWPRGTFPYNMVSIFNIACLLFVRIPNTDFLRVWLGY